MLQFGSGKLYAIDANGIAIEFGHIQSADINISQETKELHGANQDAIAVVAGKRKVEGKAAYAEINAEAMNLLLNGVISSGRKIIKNEVLTTDGTGKAIGTLVTGVTGDRGVWDCSDPNARVAMTRIATGTPVAGEYTFNAATCTYTFASSFSTKAVEVAYEATVADGKTIKLASKPMGQSPKFIVQLENSNGFGFKMNACVSKKLDFGFKQEDFVIPNFEFTAMTDSAGVLGEFYLANK